MRPKPIRRYGYTTVWAVVGMLVLAVPAAGQSVYTGTLSGRVTGPEDEPLAGARVEVTEVATGVTRDAMTDQAGGFSFDLLPPGDYDVLAEELGYQPERVERVPVHPGRTLELTVTLREVQLPIHEIGTAPYAAPVQDSRAGEGQWLAALETAGLPDERRGLTELGRYSTVSNSALDTEGLPGWLSGIAADGMLYSPTRHPDLPAGRARAEALPLSVFSSAELLTNPLDVEWSEFAGAYLTGQTRRGTRRPELLAYGDWTGGSATQSDFFSGNDVGTNSFRGGAVVSGPILPDTAHFVVGFEAQRLQTPLPPAWTIDTLDSALIEVARDSFGVDIAAYTRARTIEEKTGTAHGRFDWQITENNALTMRGSLARVESGGSPDFDPRFGLGGTASLGSKLEGTDLSTAGLLASRLSSVVSQELRVGIDRTQREYTGTDVPGTRIVDGGLAFGTDPAVPGKFDQLTARFYYTLHLALARHAVKVGLGLTHLSAEQRYSYANGGDFAFAGVDEFAGALGSFEQASGTAPFGKFSNWQFAFYVQDTWHAAPGLDVLVGLRYEHERLDSDQLALNEEWLERTGIANTAIDSKLDKYSPRVGLRWDIGNRGAWLVRAGWGIYQHLVDPADFAEIVTHDGRVSTRRGLGDLGVWPEAPGLGEAPLLGTRLSSLGPEFQGPRTSRVSLGISRLLADRTAIHLSGAYRYTDHLARRRDLNLSVAPTSVDQYGRPIYGNLVQQGSLLTVEPGSNRRFEDFATVSALNADGVSSYWGGTIAVERHSGEWLDLIASYTYSSTEDNWLSGRSGGPAVELTPFPDSLDRRDWTKGTSDFDRPHSLVLGAQLKFGLGVSTSRLAAYYRYSSGVPFTPGFRDAVDVNGDGSGRNDPAFIDDTIEGMEELLGAWDCLAEQAGRFAARNSCRGPDLHRLDLRFALGVYSFFSHPLELVVDALNVLDTDLVIPDRAVFLIDRSGSLEADPDGTINVPLVVNPHFGEPLVRNSTGRSFRLGIRMGI